MYIYTMPLFSMMKMRKYAIITKQWVSKYLSKIEVDAAKWGSVQTKGCKVELLLTRITMSERNGTQGDKE